MKRLILALCALSLAALAGVFIPAPVYAQSADSSSAYYTNSRGNRVHRSVPANRPPADASAKCRDGTYSFSQSRRGTCSHHGGVASWL